MRDSGQIPVTEAQNDDRRQRNVRFFGDDVFFMLSGRTMKFIGAHPEVTEAPLISRITTLRINTLMFEIN